MNWQIHIKSFLVGILVTICIGLAMGARFSSSTSEGRFQMAMVENHAFVIDTSNGRVWEKFLINTQGQTSNDFLADKIANQETGKD